MKTKNQKMKARNNFNRKNVMVFAFASILSISFMASCDSEAKVDEDVTDNILVPEDSIDTSMDELIDTFEVYDDTLELGEGIEEDIVE